jgi:putative Flp pilus-assembly TadE/G-like protein
MKTRAPMDRRSGQIVVLFVFVMVVVLAFAMFAVDMGHVMTTDARLQNAVDAATLAAGQVLLEQYKAGAEETEARAAADSEAAIIQSLNMPGGRMEVEYGKLADDGTFVAVADTEHATAVRGRACRDDAAPGGPCGLFFAPTMGLNDVDLACTATTQIASSINTVYRNLSPFAVPEEAIPGVGHEMIFFPAVPDEENPTSLGDDMYVGGNWGLIDLTCTLGAASNVDLARWIRFGYDGTIEIPPEGTWFDGSPGINAALKTPLAEKLGHQMIILVFDQYMPTDGANARFHITGFVVVTLTAVQLLGGNKSVRARVEKLTNIADVGTGPVGWTGSNIRKIQLVE